jgi:hypothetical protein
MSEHHRPGGVGAQHGDVEHHLVIPSSSGELAVVAWAPARWASER